MAGKITLYEHAGFQGHSWEVSATTGKFTGAEYRSASSLDIQGFKDTDWNAFYETYNETDDDVLFVQGNGRLANLHAIERPHGKNHWNDLISQVQVNVQPPWNIDNETRIFHGSRRYRNGEKGERQLDGENPEWGG